MQAVHETIKNTDQEVWDLLWQALDGGDHDLDALKRKMTAGDSFEAAGLDSLDVTDFYLRVQDHFKVTLRREDYPSLSSVGGVQAYVRNLTAS
jgi:acyl carrier protein